MLETVYSYLTVLVFLVGTAAAMMLLSWLSGNRSRGAERDMQLPGVARPGCLSCDRRFVATGVNEVEY